MKNIVVSISSQYSKKIQKSVDFNKLVNQVSTTLGWNTFNYQIEEMKSDNEVIYLTFGKDEVLVALSSTADGARNVFIGQPMTALLKKYGRLIDVNYSNVFIYIRNHPKGLHRLTSRILFDIKCFKSSGIRFIGEDNLEDKKRKLISISSITPYQTNQEWYGVYKTLSEKSERKSNDVTNIEIHENFCKILQGKTEGATYGSFIPHIIYASKNFEKLEIFPFKGKGIRTKNEEHDLSSDMMPFFTKFGITFHATNNDFQNREKAFTKLQKKVNPKSIKIKKRAERKQNEFTKNLIFRVGDRKICELTTNESLVSTSIISSHILPVYIIKKLEDMGHLTPNQSEELINSPFNGLRICTHFDGLFDKGKLSFDDNGTPLLKEENQTTLNLIDKELNLTNEMKVFMELNRKYVFEKTPVENVTKEEIEKLKTLLNNS